MTTLRLRRGEALRIDGAGLRLLVLPTPAGYEIRREWPGFFARIAAGWRARRNRIALEALDPRTLRDIGLAELALRVAERRRLEARWARLAGL